MALLQIKIKLKKGDKTGKNLDTGYLLYKDLLYTLFLFDNN